MRVRFLLLSVFSMVLLSCASKKVQERPRYDVMDNLTSKYNILYHGKKLIRETEEADRQSYVMDFGDHLPIFIEPLAPSTSQQVLLDSVIGKANRIINDKSEGKHVRDAYFLLGRANYLKGNYFLAAEYFDYLATAFGQDAKYRQLGLLWQARALGQLGNLSQSGRLLDSVFKDLGSYKKIQGLAFAVRADHQRMIGNLGQAASMLDEAVSLRGNKKDKHRWRFIVAQYVQDLGYNEEAVRRFKRVARANVPYELSFEAQLRAAFLAADPTQGQDRIRAFRRMLRDGKNKDFKDQIEYHLARHYLDMGLEEEGLRHFAKSLGHATQNRLQTAKTYLALGDFHLNRRNFEDASLYFDSAAMFLPANFIDRDGTRKRLAHVGELIQNFQTIARQDTLLFLASLNEADRQSLVDSFIRRDYQLLVEKQQNAPSAPKRRAATETAISPFERVDAFSDSEAYADNRFYFNNPDALGMGMAGFKRKWGTRALTDNWRFSADAEMTLSDGNAQTSEPRMQEKLASQNPVTLPELDVFAEQYRENLLADLPLGEDQQMSTRNTLIDALERIGAIYRDQLGQNEDAVGVYEDLLDRFPEEDKKTPSWYYNLYLLHGQQDLAKSVDFRNRLLEEFPESPFARILENPRYFEELEAEKGQLNVTYERVYQLYANAEFEEVIAEVDRVLHHYEGSQSSVLPQLAYLKSLAIGKTADLSSFVGALEAIKGQFPMDELITPLVVQHLRYIDEHSIDFQEREFALVGLDSSKNAFFDEPRLTPWPALLIRSRNLPERERSTSQHSLSEAAGLVSSGVISSAQQISERQISSSVAVEEAPTSQPTEGAFAEEDTYYFVIHVLHPSVNLAPSRFGIGQFNRTRHAAAGLSHQLKVIEDESQLIYIGPFNRFSSVKAYEKEILPLLADVMKIPADYYQSFAITESQFGTLSDFDSIDKYVIFYQQQP